MEHKVDEIKRVVESVANHRGGNQNVTRLEFNAGGVGVWLATTAAGVCLVVTFIIGFLFLDLRAEQRDTAAHLETIYMLVPALREQVQANLNTKEKVPSRP